jgi:hypothetical protein
VNRSELVAEIADYLNDCIDGDDPVVSVRYDDAQDGLVVEFEDTTLVVFVEDTFDGTLH